MGAPNIPYSQPYLTPDDEASVAEVVRSGRLVMGPRVAGFEAAVAAFAGRRHAVAVSSGTAALSVSLQGLGVGPGWDVLVPAYTWVATYNVPLRLGARPVLVDVDPRTFCIDEGDLAAALAEPGSPRRLILPVHLFGYRAGGAWLAPLARAHGAQVVGDGCCAFGGEDHGVRCGAWTEIECLSFHPRKVITTGEGGMVLLDDDALAARLRRLRDHGAERSDEQRRQTGQGGALVPLFPEPGDNLRLTEMQGALGEAQMRSLPAILEGRRRAARRYDERLARGPEWLKPPPGEDDPGRLLTCYVVQVWGQRDRPPSPGDLERLGPWRDRILEGLAEAGIAARPPMIDLVSLPYVTKPERRPMSGTQVASRLSIGLPFFPALADEDIDRVARVLLRVGEASRPR